MDWLQLLCNEKPQKSPGSMYTCLVPSSCQSFLVSISAPDIWCFGYLWVLSLDQQYSIEDSNLRKPLVTYRIWLHFRQVPFPWLADISFNMNPLLWEVCDIQYVVRYEIVWSSYSGQIDLRSAPHNIQDVPDGFATVETTWICDRGVRNSKWLKQIHEQLPAYWQVNHELPKQNLAVDPNLCENVPDFTSMWTLMSRTHDMVATDFYGRKAFTFTYKVDVSIRTVFFLYIVHAKSWI